MIDTSRWPTGLTVQDQNGKNGCSIHRTPAVLPGRTWSPHIELSILNCETADRTPVKWKTSATVEILGSLVVFALLLFGIHGTGMAPFNLPPSAAFLEKFGLNVGPLPLPAHFGYRAWSMVLVALFGRHTSLEAGLTLATGLWLFMMLVYSPVIGWGVRIGRGRPFAFAGQSAAPRIAGQVPGGNTGSPPDLRRGHRHAQSGLDLGRAPTGDLRLSVPPVGPQS